MSKVDRLNGAKSPPGQSRRTPKKNLRNKKLSGRPNTSSARQTDGRKKTSVINKPTKAITNPDNNNTTTKATKVLLRLLDTTNQLAISATKSLSGPEITADIQGLLGNKLAAREDLKSARVFDIDRILKLLSKASVYIKRTDKFINSSEHLTGDEFKLLGTALNELKSSLSKLNRVAIETSKLPEVSRITKKQTRPLAPQLVISEKSTHAVFPSRAESTSEPIKNLVVFKLPQNPKHKDSEICAIDSSGKEMHRSAQKLVFDPINSGLKTVNKSFDTVQNSFRELQRSTTRQSNNEALERQLSRELKTPDEATSSKINDLVEQLLRQAKENSCRTLLPLINAVTSLNKLRISLFEKLSRGKFSNKPQALEAAGTLNQAISAADDYIATQAQPNDGKGKTSSNLFEKIFSTPA